MKGKTSVEDNNVDLFGNKLIEPKLIDRETLTAVFKNTMRGINESDIVSMLYSKFDAIIDFARLCKGEKAGEKISMLFNPHRFSTDTTGKPSIVKGFNNDGFLSGLARACLFMNGKTKQLFYHSIQIGINGHQYVNEFPPVIARDFYTLFSGQKILDPCAGWGGRMIGAASVGAFYHGFEPSTKTYNGLLKLGEFLKLFKTGFDFKIECLPFEDADIKEKYDVALTSPPYYDTELYSAEETNSCNRYKDYNSWCNGFYIPMIKKVLQHVETFIINVGNRRYPLKQTLYDYFPKTQEIKSRLAGHGGLGKKEDGKESFFIVKN